METVALLLFALTCAQPCRAAEPLPDALDIVRAVTSHEVSGDYILTYSRTTTFGDGRHERWTGRTEQSGGMRTEETFEPVRMGTRTNGRRHWCWQPDAGWVEQRMYPVSVSASVSAGSEAMPSVSAGSSTGLIEAAFSQGPATSRLVWEVDRRTLALVGKRLEEADGTRIWSERWGEEQDGGTRRRRVSGMSDHPGGQSWEELWVWTARSSVLSLGR